MNAEYTVLIADDEDNILMSLEYLLQRAGYSVVVARDGVEVLELAAIHQPDLFLLDVMMPRLDGFSACQQLRSDRQFFETPIVMLTAKGREADIAKGHALGATDYVVKPFSTRELVRRVADWLGRDA